MPFKEIQSIQNFAVLTTEDAAKSLNLKPNTLRRWACFECGPIRPIRIGRRLGWRISDLQALLDGGR